MTYRVRIYHYPSSLTLVPCKRVDESGNYSPSKELDSQIDHMWKHRNPREIGFVSEMVAKEIIGGGQMRIGKNLWRLSCQSFNFFADSNGMSLRPAFGIRSDDLVTIATTDRAKLIFVTESKGTTQKRGFSHPLEAEIFYQLPRTVKRLNTELSKTKNLTLGGVISSQVNHYSKEVTINTLDKNASLATVTPDSWMYKNKIDGMVLSDTSKRLAVRS